LAKNLKSVVGTFSETILAINGDGSIAVSADYIFDGTSFAVKRPTPLKTNTMAMSADGTTLYLYDTTSSRIYIYGLE
jgi:sugar lactone lactonase YvrE